MKESFDTPITFRDLCDFVSPIRIIGNCQKDVIGYAPLDNSSPQHLSFCSRKGELAVLAISESKAGIIISNNELPGLEKLKNDKCILTVKSSRLTFIQCLNHFFKPKLKWGMHPTAIIEPNAIIARKTSIGAMAYIGNNVEIGEGAIIENRVQIASNSVIGRNVYIQTGAVIGCEGQGFERNENGFFEKFHQIGRVILEDDVEIGANSTIVRGTFSETRIGKGSKIGHLTDIGHNVHVGCHVFISAGVVVGGSSIIGDFSWLAPRCCIRNKLKIGKKVTVGLGAVVINDVDDYITVVGVPARPLEK